MRILPPDYHIHTALCRHGEGEVAEYVESALAMGLQEIGFSEHIPMPQIYDPTGRMHISEFPYYVKQIESARVKYPQICIRLGLEADYFPEHHDYIAEFIAGYAFDYVIGSVHFLGDWNFDHPDYISRYEEYGVDAVYRDYYALIRQTAASALFDSIGHFDLPKKFGHRPSCDLSDEVETTLQAIRDHGLALDVNTAGLRKPVGELYPSEEILNRAAEMGIPVMLGSDAHHPREVGWAFAATCCRLQELGFTSTVQLEQRRKKAVPLPDIDTGPTDN